MSKDGCKNTSISGRCSRVCILLHSSQGRWVEGSAVATKNGFHADPREMPARIHSGIYTLGPDMQHTEYDLVTSPGQCLSNKGPGSQSGPLLHMQRGDETTGHNAFGQHGTTAGIITFSP